MKVEAMLWMLILVALAFAIVSPRYRKYGLAIVGLAVVTVVAIIVLARRSEIPPPLPLGLSVQRSKRVDFEQLHIDKLDQEDPEAKTRIKVSEIRFDQIRPFTGAEAGTIESVRARLHNDSPRFTLTDYAYELVVQDCVEKVCTTVYDQRGRASSAVPANQARDVVIDIRGGETRESSPIKLTGTPKIILSASDTRAYRAPSTL
jgi:hypothetical protein